VLLWDEGLVLAEAQELLLWHEAAGVTTSQQQQQQQRGGVVVDGVEGGDDQLERRLLEYCVLGENDTAVAFLLSTTPDSSVRSGGAVV